jgi:hypothetical protein
MRYYATRRCGAKPRTATYAPTPPASRRQAVLSSLSPGSTRARADIKRKPPRRARPYNGPMFAPLGRARTHVVTAALTLSVLACEGDPDPGRQSRAVTAVEERPLLVDVLPPDFEPLPDYQAGPALAAPPVDEDLLERQAAYVEALADLRFSRGRKADAEPLPGTAEWDEESGLRKSFSLEDAP